MKPKAKSKRKRRSIDRPRFANGQFIAARAMTVDDAVKVLQRRARA